MIFKLFSFSLSLRLIVEIVLGDCTRSIIQVSRRFCYFGCLKFCILNVLSIFLIVLCYLYFMLSSFTNLNIKCMSIFFQPKILDTNNRDHFKIVYDKTWMFLFFSVIYRMWTIFFGIVIGWCMIDVIVVEVVWNRLLLRGLRCL